MTADRIRSNTGIQTRLCPQHDDSSNTKDSSGQAEAKDGGWGWFIALGSFVAHVLAGGLDRSGGIFYLKFLEKYGGSAAETAWVTALFSSFKVLFGPLASAMVNRFSGRTVVFGGALLSMTGILASGHCASLTSIYLSYGVCTGLGVAFTFAPGIILTGQFFNRRRGAVVGLTSVGAALGAFIFPPFIQLLFETYLFRGTFLLLSGVMGHFLVVGALYRSHKLHQRLILASSRAKEKRLNIEADTVTSAQLLVYPERDSKQTANTEIPNGTEYCDHAYKLQHSIENKCDFINQKIHKSQSEETAKAKVFDFSLLKDIVFLCICLQSFLYFISFNIIMTFVPALVKDRGLTAFQGSTLMSIIGISDAVTRIIASIVLDLKELKPYRLYVFNVVILITVIISTLLPSLSNFWQFVCLCGIYGCLIGTYISQWSVVTIEVVGVNNVSSGIGIVLGVNGMSALISPIFGGFLKDSFGTYTPAFYFGSAGLFLSGCVMAFGNFCFQRRKTHKKLLCSDR